MCTKQVSSIGRISWTTCIFLLLFCNAVCNGFIASIPSELFSPKLTVGQRQPNFIPFISKRRPDGTPLIILRASESEDQETSSDDDEKFSFGQRIESTKTGIVGLFAGGIALAPFSAVHDIFLGGDEIRNGVAQWEFDTDMGSIEAALFAIVYRYCVRKDANPMLNMGVIGAFILVRVLSKIQVSTSCLAAPLTCGAPLGYFNYNMLNQAFLTGIESIALFGGAAYAMDFCFNKKLISKFP
mmetsp:Transcript_19558/g.23970  ORF Transcript_19558/g.23970 Transcript_19558/m.23970 type:complete len:241 (+) Transcript_19558:64-786(+)